MTAQLSEAAVALNPISPTLNTLAKWVTGAFAGTYGAALATLLVTLSALCAFAFPFVYRRYYGILGASAKRKGTLERHYYDGLRDSLMHGNIAARLYASRLTAFLDWIDRFFGDAGMADRTLFPRAFGLKTPAPLWTAPAFDRCLLLALVYPIAVIVLIWSISGHIGPAEAALGLDNLSTRRRSLTIVSTTCSILAIWRFLRTGGWHWLAGYIVLTAITLASAGSGVLIATLNGIMAIGIASSFAGVFILPTSSGAVANGIVFATIISASFVFYFAKSSTHVYFGAIAGALVACLLNLIVAYILFWSTNRVIQDRRHGTFLAFFLFTTILLCLCAANLLALLPLWRAVGPLLLFVSFLTLINAPFDWASLGLTRALLRRGVELGGWWPYILALVDAALAAIIIALLALTMVVGVEVFDTLAVRGGGKPVLPLQPFFDGIAADPTAPEYWWVYALLLSTMIPSLVNLVIAGASLLRGIPGLPTLLLRFMPAGKAVPTFDRAWIAMVLTLQVFLGALLGVLAQAFLAIVVIVYVMPPFGLGLLDMARAVAAFDLPGRVGRLFTGM